ESAADETYIEAAQDGGEGGEEDEIGITKDGRERVFPLVPKGLKRLVAFQYGSGEYGVEWRHQVPDGDEHTWTLPFSARNARKNGFRVLGTIQEDQQIRRHRIMNCQAAAIDVLQLCSQDLRVLAQSTEVPMERRWVWRDVIQADCTNTLRAWDKTGKEYQEVHDQIEDRAGTVEKMLLSVGVPARKIAEAKSKQRGKRSFARMAEQLDSDDEELE
ncbi:hypothetical protein BGZ98_006323, partial [Dissophora globulifera]